MEVFASYDDGPDAWVTASFATDDEVLGLVVFSPTVIISATDGRGSSK